MDDSLRPFVWALFPMAFFVIAGLDRYLKYRRYRDTLEVLKTYAARGAEPPPEVLHVLTPPEKPGTDEWGFRQDDDTPRALRDWRRVAFFGCMAVAFFVGGNVLWQGRLHDPLMIVTLVFGALAIASAVSAVLTSVWNRK